MSARMYPIARALRDRLAALELPIADGDVAREMVPEAVVIRSIDEWNRADRAGFSNENLPGVFIVVPKNVSRPANGGGIEHDLVVYPFLIQLVGSSANSLDSADETYANWAELLTEEAQSVETLASIRDSVSSVYDLHSESYSPVDEQDWESHGIWRSRILLNVRSWESRR